MGRTTKNTKANTARALELKHSTSKKAGKGRAEAAGSVDLEDLLDTDGEPEKKARKPVRFRPGTVALRDIRKAQKSTELSFRKTPWQRLVKEILQDMDKGDMRVTENAHTALQTYCESWLTGLFREANRSARNARRVKITAGDWRLVHDLTMAAGLDQLMCETDRYDFFDTTIPEVVKKERGERKERKERVRAPIKAE